METLGYLASDRTSSSPTLLIPDLTATLPVMGLASSLILTSWGFKIPLADAALSRSDRCSAVTDLQNALIKAGFDPGTPDGVFGGATEYAVMRFQEKNQLKNDRIVGQATATALGLDPNISCETTPASSTTSSTTSTNTPSASPASTSTASASTTSSDTEEDESIAIVSIPVRFGKVTTEGGPLNVRSGPSVDYGVVKTINNGSSVRFVGQPVGAWLQLVDGGWIHSDWVEFTKAETTEETAPTENTTPETSASKTPAAATTASETTTSKTADSSTTAASSTEANATAANTELEAKGGPAVDLETQRVKVKTGGSALNVRESANYEAKVLKLLNDGDVVAALVPKGQQNLPEWVELSSGGWVASNWLEAQGTIVPES